MSIMEWADYSDRFYDWSENTRVRRMCELRNIGTADEITDIALEFEDDKNASKLIRKALSMGIHFSPQNITELLLTIDDTTIKQMIKSFEGEFTREWLEDIELYIDSATYNDLETRLLKKKQNYCKRERTSTIDQRTEGNTTLAYINDALNVYFSNTDLNKKRQKRSKPKIISAFLSLRKMSRTIKKIFSTPPTTKQKIAQQRSKRRRNRPWWDR